MLRRPLVARSFHAAGAAIVGVLITSPAFGDSTAERNEPIRITYVADATCPTRDAFVANVRRYTTKWRLSSDDEPNRSFRVVLEPSATHATRGTLELEATQHQTREIRGPDCEGVARALAIALAVMIDPDADLSGNAREPSDAEPSSNEPAPRQEPTRPPSPRRRVQEGGRPPSPPAPRKRAPFITVDAGFGLTSAVVPGWLPALGATVGLVAPPSKAIPWLQPEIAVGVRQSLPRDRDASGLVAEFLWTAGTLRLCPVHIRAAGNRLELTPCFETNAGVLRAAARGTPDAQTSTKPWLDFGGSGRATFRFAGPWFAGASFAAVAPFTRYRFELANAVSVSQAPPTGITFGVCTGVRF